MDLFLRQYVTPSSPGNSSPSSQSELLFLHLACSHSLFYIRVLLSIVQNLARVTAIRQEYITAFHSCSLIGGSLFFTGMTIDLYIAVASSCSVCEPQSFHKANAGTYILYIGMDVHCHHGYSHGCLNITMYHHWLGFFCVSVPCEFHLLCGLCCLSSPRWIGKESSQTSRPGQKQTDRYSVYFEELDYISNILFASHLCINLLFLYVRLTRAPYLPCQVRTSPA